jgi:hypothetical protein
VCMYERKHCGQQVARNAGLGSLMPSRAWHYFNGSRVSFTFSNFR